jgi:hypothetical protein
LEQFVAIITSMAPDSLSKASGHYWYRGQTNADWGLETSSLRMTRHLAKQREEALRLEDAAREEFSSMAHLFIDAGNIAKVKTLACWWALMRITARPCACSTGRHRRASPRISPPSRMDRTATARYGVSVTADCTPPS